MAQIPGTNLSDKIVPNDTNDIFATHDEIYGKGGWRSVQSISERDLITTDRRKEGMVVNVLDDNKAYQLKNGILNTNWVELYSSSTNINGLYGNITLIGSSSILISSNPISNTILISAGDNVGSNVSNVSKLTDLLDVIITDIQPGQTLISDGVNWYNGFSYSSSGVGLQGIIELQPNNISCTIHHSTLPSITSSFPLISLQTPNSSSNLLAMGISNRTISSFDVILSQIPNTTGYFINWSIGSVDSLNINSLTQEETTKAPTQEDSSRILSNIDNNRVLHCTSSSIYTFIVPLDLMPGFSTMFSNDSGIINVSGSNGVYINDIRSIDNTAPNISVLIQDDDNRYKLVGGKA